MTARLRFALLACCPALWLAGACDNFAGKVSFTEEYFPFRDGASWSFTRKTINLGPDDDPLPDGQESMSWALRNVKEAAAGFEGDFVETSGSASNTRKCTLVTTTNTISCADGAEDRIFLKSPLKVGDSWPGPAHLDLFEGKYEVLGTQKVEVPGIGDDGVCDAALPKRTVKAVRVDLRRLQNNADDEPDKTKVRISHAKIWFAPDFGPVRMTEVFGSGDIVSELSSCSVPPAAAPE